MQPPLRVQNMLVQALVRSFANTPAKSVPNNEKPLNVSFCIVSLLCELLDLRLSYDRLQRLVYLKHLII